MVKRPFVTKDQLEAIADVYPTPFYLYDEAKIRRRAAELNAAFAWNPGFKEYFAVKATPNPAILRILAECGCGCDCATGVELLLADRAGVTGRDIMLSSNDTPDEDFRAADERGAIINLDGPDMVACLRRALGGRVPRTVCCRVNPGGTFESANGIIGSPADSKFGMTPAQLEQAFRELAALGVEEFGIHAFLASNTQVNDYYPRLARQLFEMAADLSARLGVHVGFVDLSGGIGVAYHPDDTPCDLAVIGEGVRQAYEDVLVPAGMDDVAVFSELGRWMLAPAGALVTRVIHEKRTGRRGRAGHAPLQRGRPALREQRPVRPRPPHARVSRWRPAVYSRRGRPRPLHGLQLQRRAALRGAAAALRRIGRAHPPGRDARRLPGNAGRVRHPSHGREERQPWT